MVGLESQIEKRLINQLCCGESQWTYRGDITNEEELWNNFKYILEQNNKAVLDGGTLSDSEFAKIKNDVSHASFYDAGRWLAGENGIVQVHIQRGNKLIHLKVLDNEDVVGGTSCYEVINQYQAFATEEDKRNRRFDVTLLINGIPLIHIELKNKSHPYKEAFNQIKGYIGEGKFRGLFSNVQMFIITNEVDTKYFAPARAEDLNPKFLTGWLDKDNNPVTDFFEFADTVLKIPMAHEMVSRYTVLDNDKKSILLLRPYQIHAIEEMKKAYKKGESGYIWHTTGSGKTMTSYKATRNLLMDIASIDKTVFLVDRKDLDNQTKLAFQSYAENDTIDVDSTDDVNGLVKRLKESKRQMIVTTRQKLQTMINRRLKEGTKDYEKIRSLRVAFVVDECHRAVTPETKRIIERFFNRSMWFGFTGTPIFQENAYECKGDLAQTTEQLYGRCVHKYTIKEAIHDGAVLGFTVENFDSSDGDGSDYETESHMRSVLDVILNKSYSRFGRDNGKGKTYEAILTVKSIEIAQKYYDLLMKIKRGEDKLKINEEIFRVLPDFPKFAITYSVKDNEESSQVNQEKMMESLKDYNEMFGTHYKLENIDSYNTNLNDRLARKKSKYQERSQQLDFVIVVKRLLTGFDAPCLSTLFMDKAPTSPQDLIQAFSRTNRLFDARKQSGNIVTFQYQDEYKTKIDEAISLYSRGGLNEPVIENLDDVKNSFDVSLKTLRELVATPEDASNLSEREKKRFVGLFKELDHDFNHLKSFSNYESSMLDKYQFSEDEFNTYLAKYKNIVEELKDMKPDRDNDDDESIIEDYDLLSFNKFTVDYEYILRLIQGTIEMIASLDEDSFEKRMEEINERIEEYYTVNPKVGDILKEVVIDLQEDKESFMGRDVSIIVAEMKESAINAEVKKYADKWCIDFNEVKNEIYAFKHNQMAHETAFKNKADFKLYKEKNGDSLKKFQFNSRLVKDFKEKLMPEVKLLLL
ncbi:type I restriction enzyme, R subunit [Kandleria vitulina]|uniref:Type I restriction enzyme endonuclease subunit n=1 Tax=Kandleria vitulina TaxID=1630 RepID=A0A1H2QVV7_9FIRM|nr:HsdR family type I site-specific deoxyribonuclease [Kandleria vitulina]SDW11255.1 type I restriction enzyme, R subunit [Kandleria vitulina]